MEARPLVIFDMDGVLVDVRPSYHRAILETVRHFTGRRVSAAGIGRFKARPGFNDDWKLTRAWIRELGSRPDARDVIAHFQRLYCGKNFQGYIRRERWMADRRRLRRFARAADLAIFTGRLRAEAMFTLQHFRVQDRFARLITLDDVRRPKPNPEGLLRLVDGRPRASVLYVGDSPDDALAARRARVAFVAVLQTGAPRRNLRIREMRRLGARAVVESVDEIERWLP
ncbi:MAG TPA: HAD-IA family hydrolase [Patescibacteria group bacterium]|nr:HAD-IA family hydrolase [Patescibacteria group bacterium]